MVTTDDVRKSLGISEDYDIERDDDVKFKEIRHGVAFQCKHCQAAFVASYNQVWVFKLFRASRPVSLNNTGKVRYALATECPACKAHIAARAENSDTYRYLGQG